MNYNPQILIIEDEKNIALYIGSILKNAGYRFEIANTGECGLNLATSLCPDLVLLDLGLPDIPGFEIIEKIRTVTEIPIIVISGNTKENDKVRALDLGADDYITKPFGSNELLARIRASLRHNRKSLNHSVVYKHKNLCIDTDKHLVYLDEAPVHLTQIEYKLLSLLAIDAGKVLTYSSIIEKIWGPYMDDNNRILRVNMANIRRKLETNPAQPVHIFTEIGIGYRMAEPDS